MDALFSNETQSLNVSAPNASNAYVETDQLWLSDYTPREWVALRALWHRWEELSVSYAHPAWFDPHFKAHLSLDQQAELTWIYHLKKYNSSWPTISKSLLQIVALQSKFNDEALDFDVQSRKEWIHSVPAFISILQSPQPWIRMLALCRLRLSFHYEIDGQMKRIWANLLSDTEKEWITETLSTEAPLYALHLRFPSVRLRHWLAADATDNQRKEKLFDLGVETFGAFINSFTPAIKTRLALALPPKNWDEFTFRSFELNAGALRHLLMELFTWLKMNRKL